MHVKQYIKNLERKRCSDPLTGDEQAACKEEGNNHKKPKEDASLDLKPHVDLWKGLANIYIASFKPTYPLSINNKYFIDGFLS
jgi:hypothetical protein